MTAEDENAELKKRIAELEQRISFIIGDHVQNSKKWVGLNAMLTACLYKVGNLCQEIAKNMEVPEEMRGKAAQGFMLCDAGVLETGGMPIPKSRLRILLADDLAETPHPE